ncbi:DinB family protein [Siphonobacter sp. SORGH_AS_0500]|uniref:DinB family protein n=1 Tax=Siphonobacter sp. SORGH_AS_0500 TaxID=1864824 RepID=UPI00285D4DAC|nr:DinB family protein [Siphonobacter sp. SORGH_AS_0500]MDR6194841.1 putative damage-inducible protein DinB [Siphonobacter sp. SORGH_AS_0500]
MELIPLFLKEMEQEALTTRKFMTLIPDDKLDWAPHQKSMKMRNLATHIAELPTWVTMALTTDELDFAKIPYEEKKIQNNADLMAFFEESLANGRTQLIPENESLLNKPWTLRNGEIVYSVDPKHEVIRMAFSQITHHRAQLGVYLRLLNIPIPGSYGPSADETQH